MSTITVTPEVEVPQHFADCDSLAIGRRVLEFHALYGADRLMKLGALTDNLNLYRGECSCFARKIRHIGHCIKMARKRQEAGANVAAEIERLSLELKATSAALERQSAQRLERSAARMHDIARDALRQAVAR